MLNRAIAQAAPEERLYTNAPDLAEEIRVWLENNQPFLVEDLRSAMNGFVDDLQFAVWADLAANPITEDTEFEIEPLNR